MTRNQGSAKRWVFGARWAQTLAIVAVAGMLLATTVIAQPKGRTREGPQVLLHRKVDHTNAYDRRTELGNHIAIKVTPPERRGKPGVVLVEVYNYTKTHVSVMDFWVIMTGVNDARIEMRIKVNEMRQNWGDITEVRIPGGRLPSIKSLRVQNMQIYDEKARRIAVPVLTDLIKS